LHFPAEFIEKSNIWYIYTCVYTKLWFNKHVELHFEWDDKKANINYRKHGIRFEEAALVFDDPLAVSEQDRIENGEQRWRTIGMVGGCLLLLVAHTVRSEHESVEIVRIISARRVDRKERRHYEHG
jgi:uncharacterized protein